MMITDGHFLSATNPMATSEQRDMEALALEIARMPLVQNAAQQAAGRWRTIAGRDVPAEAWSRFEELNREWSYHYVLKAVNSDANHPKVLGNMFGPPHRWFGMNVPGCRASIGDNPDSNQVIIPVDAYSRFVLHGRRLDPTLADSPCILSGNIALSMTLASLDWQDVSVDADDTFNITVDPSPAAGRLNHIQSKPDSRYLFIRDCRSDWRQVPNAYRIERLDPPQAQALTADLIAERAAHFMTSDVPMAYWVIRAASAFEVNTMSLPFNTVSVGGLPTQMVSMGRLKLAADEAFVVTVAPGGARFRNLVIYDYWFRTFDYWNNTSTMNNAQSAPNRDETITYVISTTDPGVHNWLDTSGFSELLVTHRWQALPKQGNGEAVPAIRGELVKVNQLQSKLPEGTKRLNAEERAAQIDERRQAVALRFVDR